MSKLRKILSLSFKSVVVLSTFIGTLLSVLASGKFMTGSQVFLYFTIQSNIWIGLFCLVEGIFILKGHEENKVMGLLKLIFTVSISLTGIVFCFVLAPTMANAFTPANVLTHVLAPAFAIADFILTIRRKFRFTDNLLCCIPPLYYLGFASIGYVANWNFGGANYPYFFLNWGSPAGAFGFTDQLPFMGVFYWVLVMLVIVVGMSFIFTAVSNTKAKKK